jgi:hypothetical protein
MTASTTRGELRRHLPAHRGRAGGGDERHPPVLDQPLAEFPAADHNFPVAVWAWNAALALVCGDPVIWKPSEKTSLTAPRRGS